MLPVSATGVFAWRKRPDLPIARLLLGAGALLLFAEGLAALLEGMRDGEGPLPGLVPVAVLAQTARMAGVVLGASVIALFPGGRAERGYERFALRAMWVFPAAAALRLVTGERLVVVADGGRDDEAANPLAIDALSGLDSALESIGSVYGLVFVAGIVMLALSYRRLDQVARLQVRWLLIVAVAGHVPAQAFWALRGIGGDGFESVGNAVAFATLLGLPATVLLAIMRYRLLEVDQLIRKSLVYGALWLLIAAAYVGAAAALGIAAGERLPVALAVVLTVIATLVFQPARHRLERLAGRWVFGERLGGYELLSEEDRRIRGQAEVPS